MQGRALIVGGGIAGLAVATALSSAGWSAQVWERSSALPTTGTALGMWPEAMRALDGLGLGDRLRNRSEQRSGAEFLRPDGTVIGRAGWRQSVHLVTRPALLELLHSGVPKDVLRWDTALTELDRLPEADVVVGADGINSVVRQAFWPEATPRPLGSVAFRGTVPGRVGQVNETWGRGRLFGITPQTADMTNWFACVRADVLDGRAAHDVDAVELLRDLYGDWHPAVGDVVRRLATGSVDRRDLYEVPPLGSYVRDRTVLLGDAAHAMAPNLGRGACESLVDAVALADALSAAPSVEHGLRAYDRARRRATQRIRRMSRWMNKLSTAEHLITARNLLFGAAARLA